MFRKLVKTGEIEVETKKYPVTYYEARTLRGAKRYSCEIALSENDRIIVDGDSMNGLEVRVLRLIPATLYSRMLASGGFAAA
jgi:hypothetical protein